MMLTLTFRPTLKDIKDMKTHFVLNFPTKPYVLDAGEYAPFCQVNKYMFVGYFH